MFREGELRDNTRAEPGAQSHAEPSYEGRLPTGHAHKRGAGLNPTNRFERLSLHILGDELDRQTIEREEAGGGLCKVERHVFADTTRSIINRVDRTSDVAFDWTVNPYRGCEHGCVYCFARPFHEYLGFSLGLDFETKLVAKQQAPELLKRELAKPGWRGEPIVMSAITDIYQPIEHEMRLARQCLEVMAVCNQPVCTMTKSAMVLRDIDLWTQLSSRAAGRVIVTLVTLDHELARSLEPRASSPSARLRVIRELSEAGVLVTVNVAPIIPGLTDDELPAILEQAAAAGAQQASWVLLRLPYQLRELFFDWLERNVHPERVKKVESRLRQAFGGRLYSSAGPKRYGSGAMVESLARTFEVFTRRYGLNRNVKPLSSAGFRKPDLSGQMGLFG